MVSAAEDIRANLDTAAKALAAYYDAESRYAGDGSTPAQQTAASKQWDSDHRSAVDAVARVLTAGGSIRQISAVSHVPGHLIIDLIEDDQARADAYAAELYHLERAMDIVRKKRIADARLRHKQGESKTALADSFDVTRVTLDKWLVR